MYAHATSYSTRSRAAPRARLLYDRVVPFHARSHARTLEDAPSNVAIRKPAAIRTMRAMTVVSRLASASFASTARVDRARRSQNFSFASIDAVRVERALATTCARRRVSRGRRDEDSTSAARPRRARVAGRRVFVSRRGFVTYTTRSNARVVSHENEQIRWAPRASVGRSVGRPGRWPQSRAGVRRRRERGRRRGRPWVATARAMSAPTLTNMLDARVSVITNDGRHIVGTLRGFDQVTNVILEDCAERVYSSESGVEEAPLGVYMIRGDNVCVNARRRRRGGRGIEWTEDARARSNARDAKD